MPAAVVLMGLPQQPAADTGCLDVEIIAARVEASYFNPILVAVGASRSRVIIQTTFVDQETETS